ncbi:MAG: Crp/Fnr family transcriptional regulator, partial [Clostridia bacterium]|nr:Crp/Fnr family transcriptional regulator [Clostridia bacterium]
DGEASMLMSMLGPGSIFGAASLFGGEGRYVAHIAAEKSTWALLIEEAAFKMLVKESPEIAENYIAYLTGRIRFLSGRIDGFVKPGCEERVLLYLSRNAQEGEWRAEMGIRAMAETLGISRASLYRALDALEDKGVIERDGRSFRLLKGEGI